MSIVGILRVVVKTWDNFVQLTSIAGLANSGNKQNSPFRRLFWLAAFAIMFYISLSQIIVIVEEFFTYPLTTKVTVVRRDILSKIIALNKKPFPW